MMAPAGEAVRETSIRARWHGAPTSLTHDLGQIRKALKPPKMLLEEGPVAFVDAEGLKRRTGQRDISKVVDS